jgi:hypothetical protein
MTGAFAVRSAAGFGAVLIAMPMLAFVLPVSTAVSVTTADDNHLATSCEPQLASGLAAIRDHGVLLNDWD